VFREFGTACSTKNKEMNKIQMLRMQHRDVTMTVKWVRILQEDHYE